MRVLEVGTLVSDWSGGSEGKGGRRMTESRGERARRTPDITIHDPDDVIGGVAGGGSGERATGTPTPSTISQASSSTLLRAGRPTTPTSETPSVKAIRNWQPSSGG